jgi:SAM-dependent methyltransferase
MHLNLWNFYARYYEFLRSNPISKTFQNDEIKSIQELLSQRTSLPTKGQAVDLGTGRGSIIKYIPSDIIKIFALDKSPKMVSLTGKRYSNVDVCIGDVNNTPYVDRSMDLIFCVGVSEYMQSLTNLLIEMRRLLRENGYIILTSSPPNTFNHSRKLIGHSLNLR